MRKPGIASSLKIDFSCITSLRLEFDHNYTNSKFKFYFAFLDMQVSLAPTHVSPSCWNFLAGSLIESESGWIFMSFNCCIFSSTLEVVATTSEDPA